MASFPNGGVVTNLGLDLKAKVEAGATLNLLRLVMGDGVAAGGTDLKTLTSLVNEKKSWGISSAAALGGGRTRIRTVLTNAGVTTGWCCKECGIIALDPDVGEILYTYAAADPGDWMPAESEQFQQIFDHIALTGNASTINVTLAPNIAALTLADMQEHEAKQLDPTDTDPVKNRHLSNAQAKVWQDHSGNADVHVTSAQKTNWDAHTADQTIHTSFPAGTSMLFNQSSAPTGWAKKEDWAANASLIIGNTHGSGGADSPVSWTTAVAVAAHATHTHAGPNHRHKGPSHNHMWYDFRASAADRTFTSNGNYQNITWGSSAVAAIDVIDGGSGALNIDSYTNKSGTGYTEYSGTEKTGPAGPTAHSVGQDTYKPKYQIVISATKK